MKKFIIATAILTASFNTFAVPTAKTIQIGLDGLVCAFCAQGVEKKLKAQAATDKVFVSLENKVALVSLKEGLDISDAVITSQITDAGYAVKSIKRSDEAFDALRGKIKNAK